MDSQWPAVEELSRLEFVSDICELTLTALSCCSSSSSSSSDDGEDDRIYKLVMLLMRTEEKHEAFEVVKLLYENYLSTSTSVPRPYRSHLITNRYRIALKKRCDSLTFQWSE